MHHPLQVVPEVCMTSRPVQAPVQAANTAYMWLKVLHACPGMQLCIMLSDHSDCALMATARAVQLDSEAAAFPPIQLRKF